MEGINFTSSLRATINEAVESLVKKKIFNKGQGAYLATLMELEAEDNRLRDKWVVCYGRLVEFRGDYFTSANGVEFFVQNIKVWPTTDPKGMDKQMQENNDTEKNIAAISLLRTVELEVNITGIVSTSTYSEIVQFLKEVEDGRV